ncbi:hypothetical protein RTG_00756 [Rhodotorula toruloides ATCC 204091]|nr:hypothetical protein RTG_00756 [Rhodotorula toruloides ATCC 204091]
MRGARGAVARLAMAVPVRPNLRNNFRDLTGNTRFHTLSPRSLLPLNSLWLLWDAAEPATHAIHPPAPADSSSPTDQLAPFTRSLGVSWWTDDLREDDGAQYLSRPVPGTNDTIDSSQPQSAVPSILVSPASPMAPSLGTPRLEPEAGGGRKVEPERGEEEEVRAGRDEAGENGQQGEPRNWRNWAGKSPARHTAKLPSTSSSSPPPAANRHPSSPPASSNRLSPNARQPPSEARTFFASLASSIPSVSLPSFSLSSLLPSRLPGAPHFESMDLRIEDGESALSLYGLLLAPFRLFAADGFSFTRKCRTMRVHARDGAGVCCVVERDGVDEETAVSTVSSLSCLLHRIASRCVEAKQHDCALLAWRIRCTRGFCVALLDAPQLFLALTSRNVTARSHCSCPLFHSSDLATPLHRTVPLLRHDPRRTRLVLPPA